MRIITGKYKGRHFDIPRSFKARPTTDFAKENIFNVLTQYIDFEGAEALDLFSGTGSITLELLSRGCSRVVSVELDRDHHRFICDCIGKLLNKQRTNTDNNGQSEIVRVNPMPNCLPLRGDVFRYIKSCKQQFDFIFADPPYALKELPTIPSLIFERGLLKNDGIFVFEHGKDNDFSDDPHFVEHRCYGSVNFSIFRTTGPSDE
jgi:16S rRNA (guanine(966)-N(2))-methyltransferase RsmD